MKIWINNIILLIILLGISIFISCGGGDSVPKPKGYFRIDLPKNEYKLFDTTYPFSFEYPVYSQISPDSIKNAEPYWININFPKFKGQLHLSYKVVKNNLSKYSEDAYNLAMKHIVKASNIDDTQIKITKNKVYGIIYDIEGIGTASSYQFYVTDSTNHFLRGALYFNVAPNNDSLAPVITFLKKDIKHMIETLKWKKV